MVLKRFYFIVGFVITVSASSAQAQPGPLHVTFQKIADTTTPIPDGQGNFNGFRGPGTANLSGPSHRNGQVSFEGADSQGRVGIYRFVNGVLERVADHTTTIPGRLDTYANLQVPSIEDDEVAFLGSGTGTGVGLYSTVGGLHLVADTNTPTPTGTGNFFTFGRPRLADGLVYYGASNVFAAQGIYRESPGSAPHIMADTNTAIPFGTGNFQSFAGPFTVQPDGVVAFQARGSGGQEGVYSASDGVVRIADTNSPPPNGGLFHNFREPSISDLGVAFFAFTQPDFEDPGIFLAKGPAQVEVVADTSTIMPGKAVPFVFFEPNPSISRGNVLFGGEGTSGVGRGLYGQIGGALHRIAQRFDLLDGKFISRTVLESHGFDGHRAAVAIAFTNNTPGLYLLSLFRHHDFDLNGTVDLSDFLAFDGCFAGPQTPLDLLPPDSVARCLNTFDVDEDDDIDLRDAGVLFARHFP